jgi:hypothetical protein
MDQQWEEYWGGDEVGGQVGIDDELWRARKLYTSTIEGHLEIGKKIPQVMGDKMCTWRIRNSESRMENTTEVDFSIFLNRLPMMME